MSDFNFSSNPQSADVIQKSAIDIATEAYDAFVTDNSATGTITTEDYVADTYAAQQRLQQAATAVQPIPSSYIGNKNSILREVNKFCQENLKLVPDKDDAEILKKTPTFFTRYVPTAGTIVSNENFGTTGNQLAVEANNLLGRCGVGRFNRLSTLQCVMRDLAGETPYNTFQQITCTEGLGAAGKGESWITYTQGQEVTPSYKSPLLAAESYICGENAAIVNSGLKHNRSLALEAFGTGVNHLPIDNRLNLSLTIDRACRSQMDRLVYRRACKDGHFVMSIPWGEAYVLTQSNSPNYEVRNNAGIVLNELYRNPTPINTQPQPVEPLPANDTATPKWLVVSVVPSITDPTYINTGVTANLWALTDNQNRMGYTATNFTDLIAEGGCVKSVLLKVTNGSGPSATEEYFTVPTKYLQIAKFQRTNNNSSSMILTVNFDVTTALRSGTLTYSGAPTSIFADFTTSVVQVKITGIAPSLQINNGDFTSNVGGVQPKQLLAQGAQAIAPEETTTFNNLKFEVIGIQPELYFDEENLRKTNLAFRTLMHQYSFTVPQARSIICDFALQQADDTETLNGIGTLICEGNDIRQYTMLNNDLVNVAGQLQLWQSNPEFQDVRLPRLMSITASQIFPYILQDTWNLNNGSINNMRSAELPTDVMDTIGYRLQNFIAHAETTSLLNRFREPGQQVVYRIFTHNFIARMLFGIRQYHLSLDYPGTKNTGADVSLGLPNGYRLDIVGTNWDLLRNKMLIIPYNERDPGHWSSCAQILDAASYSAVFPYTRFEATTRRIVHNSREIILTMTPVAALLEFQNIDQVFGTSPGVGVALNNPALNQMT